MKKIIALLMAAAMVLAMAACGASNAASLTESAASEALAAAESAVASAAEVVADATDSDMAYVQTKGTLVVGITDFEPMDYKDDAGNWIGFDADMAAAFAASLGVAVEFVEIDWDNKIMELDGKTIDCVWNGMTLTPEVTASMECSNAYCNNAQVVIVPAAVADQYQDADSIKDLNFAVEAGSAGEQVIAELGYAYTSVKAQSDGGRRRHFRRRRHRLPDGRRHGG